MVGALVRTVGAVEWCLCCDLLRGCRVSVPKTWYPKLISVLTFTFYTYFTVSTALARKPSVCLPSDFSFEATSLLCTGLYEPTFSNDERMVWTQKP